jgi:hypothetical protein
MDTKQQPNRITIPTVEELRADIAIRAKELRARRRLLRIAKTAEEAGLVPSQEEPRQ